MSSGSDSVPIDSIAGEARPSTEAERQAMMDVVARLDSALKARDYSALIACFDPSGVCELKPIGVRLTKPDTIAEMFRRTLPALSEAFAGRRQQRQWSNQNGIVREWSYPVRCASGKEVPTTQLEIIEFTSGLEAIASYRLRMNNLYSEVFEDALGQDFLALPEIERVPR